MLPARVRVIDEQMSQVFADDETFAVPLNINFYYVDHARTSPRAESRRDELTSEIRGLSFLPVLYKSCYQAKVWGGQMTRVLNFLLYISSTKTNGE